MRRAFAFALTVAAFAVSSGYAQPPQQKCSGADCGQVNTTTNQMHTFQLKMNNDHAYTPKAEVPHTGQQRSSTMTSERYQNAHGKDDRMPTPQNHAVSNKQVFKPQQVGSTGQAADANHKKICDRQCDVTDGGKFYNCHTTCE